MDENRDPNTDLRESLLTITDDDINFDFGNIDENDENGCTSFHRACENGNKFDVQLMIKKLQKLNRLDILEKTNKIGQTPLTSAVRGGYTEVVRMLLNSNVDVTLADTPTGRNALMIASDLGFFDIVTVIVECEMMKGINNVDNSSNSALWLACKNGHDRIVKLLLSYGANVSLPGQSGMTPYDIAFLHEHSKLATYLKTYEELYGENGAPFIVYDPATPICTKKCIIS